MNAMGLHNKLWDISTYIFSDMEQVQSSDSSRNNREYTRISGGIL